MNMRVRWVLNGQVGSMVDMDNDAAKIALSRGAVILESEHIRTEISRLDLVSTQSESEKKRVREQLGESLAAALASES